MTSTTTTTTPQLDWLLRTPIDPNGMLEGRKLPSHHSEGNEANVRNWSVNPIECADGTTISVQAGRTMYSWPRNDNGPWREVELGFPSVDPGPKICAYQDGDGDPTQTVFGYVPVDLVRAFIAEHGGEKLA